MIADIGAVTSHYRKIWRGNRIAALLPLSNTVATAMLLVMQRFFGDQVALDFEHAKAGLEELLGISIATTIIALGYLSAGSYRLFWCCFGALASLSFLAGTLFSGFTNWSDMVATNQTIFNQVFALVAVALLFVAWASIWSLSRTGQGTDKPFVKMKLFDALVRQRRQSYSALKKYWLLIAPVCLLVFLVIAIGGFDLSVRINHALFPFIFAEDVSTIAKFNELSNKYPVSSVIGSAIGLAGYAATPIGALLAVNLGKRLMQRQAVDLIKGTDYAPIVFLRSFQDESVKVRPISYVRLLSRYFPRLEQVIVNTLGKLGPPVAIGLPGERLPPLGAMRAYYSNDEWQAALSGWLDRAFVVAVMLGSTPWALWEINHLLSNGFDKRLIVVIPHDRQAERAKERWSKFVEAASETGWSAALRDVDPTGLRALIFLPGGEVRGFRSAGSSQADYEFAIRSCAVGLFVQSS